jgi:hypothetical protein
MRKATGKNNIDLAAYTNPLWKADTVVDESQVMQGQGRFSAKLLFRPGKYFWGEQPIMAGNR